MPEMGTPLIGRSEELRLVSAALADPSVNGVVVIGAGGIGKTRFAREIVDVAHRAGFSTVSVLATKAASAIPLGAFDAVIGGTSGGASPLRMARAALLEAAGGSPLVLMVDDAHLLDPTSAALLLRLADDDAVFVVATVRHGEHVPDAVTALWKDAGARRLDLPALSGEESEDLLHALVGGPVAVRTVGMLVGLSRGNPMALAELVEATRTTGRLEQAHGIWSLQGDVAMSPRLIDLVERRIGQLDPGERDALATVALADPLPLPLAERVVEHDVLRSLEDRQLVIVRRAIGGEEVTVAHPLYGEVVLGSLGDLRRRDLLATLVDAASAHTEMLPNAALRIASWQLDSGREVDADLMIAGARAAYAMHEHASTAALARAAWDRSPSAEAGYLYGFALGRLGRFGRAEQVLGEATSLANDDRERVLLALAHSELLLRGSRRVGDAVALVESAQATVDDPTWQAELLAHRAMLVLQSGRADDAVALVEPLLAPGVEARPFVKAAYVVGPAWALGGRTTDALDLAGRALPVHEDVAADDLFQTESAVHHITAMLALVESGQLLDAERYAEVGVVIASEDGGGYGFGYMAMLSGLVALRRGHVMSAARRCHEATEPFERGGFVAQQRLVVAGAALATALAGDAPSARALLDEADALGEGSEVHFNEGVVDEARGWVLLAEGTPDDARAAFRDGADRAITRGERAIAAHLLHAVARLGGAATVLDALDDLGDHVDGDLAHARLAHVRALVGDDAAALDELSGRFEAMGADLLAAEAAADAAGAHRRRGSSREATRARRRVDELAARCEGARTPALVVTDAVDPLTTREREIALLAAEGLSSKDIAERLVVSRRTVDNHLQRAFTKLGISRRADLPDALGIGR